MAKPEISSLQKSIFKNPSVRIYLDSSPDSREVFEAFQQAGERFLPIKSADSPAVEALGAKRVGKDASLQILQGLRGFDRVIKEGMKKMYPAAFPRNTDTELAQWIRQQMRLEWALGEAIVEGRSFTSLSEDYIERWDRSLFKIGLAYGEAVADGRPFTLLNGKKRIN